MSLTRYDRRGVSQACRLTSPSSREEVAALMPEGHNDDDQTLPRDRLGKTLFNPQLHI
ncbi:hypothetical protein ACYOEI_25520 [Singulisphaera rosea]